MSKLTLYTYSGMPIPIENGDTDDCRAHAARLIRRRRKQGHVVAMLERGVEWEIQERDDAFMISDHSGILNLKES